MPSEVIAALLSSVIGGLVVAVVNIIVIVFKEERFWVDILFFSSSSLCSFLLEMSRHTKVIQRVEVLALRAAFSLIGAGVEGPANLAAC